MTLLSPLFSPSGFPSLRRPVVQGAQSEMAACLAAGNAGGLGVLAAGPAAAAMVRELLLTVNVVGVQVPLGTAWAGAAAPSSETGPGLVVFGRGMAPMLFPLVTCLDEALAHTEAPGVLAATADAAATLPLVRELRQRRPSTAVIAGCGCRDSASVAAALAAGASAVQLDARLDLPATLRLMADPDQEAHGMPAKAVQSERDARREREAAALRENLRRRKAQTRGRSD